MFKIVETLKNDGNLVVRVEENGKEWKSFQDKAFVKLHKNLDLKGFRKGNIPVEIAKQTISEQQIWNEAIGYIIDEQLEYINEELVKEKIISRPKLEVESVNDEEVILIFSAPLLPEVNLGDLSLLKFEMESYNPTQEEIDNEFSKLDALFFDFNEVEGPIQDGDTANIDFVGKVDGKEFEGGSAKGHNLDIGSKSFIEGFEEQLLNLNKNDKKVVKVKFPETYPVEELANKDAEFDVTINSIKRKTRLSNEQIETKILGFGFKNLEELKSSVGETFKEQRKLDAYNKFIRNIISEIKEMEHVQITLHDTLIDQEIATKLDQFKHQLEHSGLKLKDYLKMINKTEKEFIDDDLKNTAINSLKEQIIFEALDETLNFEISDQELEKEYEKISNQQKISIEDLKEQIKPSELKQELKFKKIVESFIK